MIIWKPKWEFGMPGAGKTVAHDGNISISHLRDRIEDVLCRTVKPMELAFMDAEVKFFQKNKAPLTDEEIVEFLTGDEPNEN